MPGSFFDTNILVYLASHDQAKAQRAEELVAGGGTISVQVLNELANVARRKMQLTWQECREFLSLVRALLSVEPINVETHESGLMLAERYNLRIYDAMIVASALGADCDTLWTEDLQHGMSLSGRLRIINPFSLPPTRL
jgi:predicted nucleic acid-binding protein